MRLSVYASRSHYWRHLAPIVSALRARGADLCVWTERHGEPWGEAITPRTAHLVAPTVLVASPMDADRFPKSRVIYVEHGAGQTYNLEGSGLRPHNVRFSGCEGLAQVALFCCPNQAVADRWRTRYPPNPQGYPQTVVGGCAALDRHLRSRRDEAPDSAPHRPRRLVAITDHWSMGANEIPEMLGALSHHAWAIPDVAERYDVVGHAHPRDAQRAERQWGQLGIRFEPDPDKILETAGVLVAGNTSLMYEAAALDVPVVALNAPWYRRDITHGLRFWQAVPGIQCDEPEHLPHCIEAALEDAPPWPSVRAHAARAAYASLEGDAADRFADAICALEE